MELEQKRTILLEAVEEALGRSTDANGMFFSNGIDHLSKLVMEAKSEDEIHALSDIYNYMVLGWNSEATEERKKIESNLREAQENGEPYKLIRRDKDDHYWLQEITSMDDVPHFIPLTRVSFDGWELDEEDEEFLYG